MKTEDIAFVILFSIVWVSALTSLTIIKIKKDNKPIKQKTPKKKSNAFTGYYYKGIPLRIFKHTREYDGNFYYTLALGRVGYPGQWVYPDPDGNDYSDNCYAAKVQQYKTFEEAKIDAEKRIDKNIAAHKEYLSRRYTQNEM